MRAFSVPVGSCSQDRPNLRFGLLSDLHIRCGTDPWVTPEFFERALRWFDRRGVDAVVIAGDMSDLGLGDELMLVAKTWFKVFPNDRAADGRRVERIFVTGNHECAIFSGNANLAKIRKLYNGDDAEVRRQLLRADFAGWWERAFGESYERFYHRNVKGYDFLGAHWDSGKPLPDLPLDSFGWTKGKIPVGGETFGVELQAWLDSHGKALDPRRPFFYQQHRVLADTNYGSWAWNHDRGLATKALSAYPNAFAFAGDTHYSLTDERSIWQGAFTSVGTGSLRYTGLPVDSRVGGYENASGPERMQRPYDARVTPQGQLVSVYDDRVVFERRDFAVEQPLGEDWVVPLAVMKPRPYAFAERKAKARPPEFTEGAKLELAVVRVKAAANPKIEKLCVRMMIPPVPQSEKVRCLEYEVAFVGRGSVRKVFHVLAEGFTKPVGHARVSKPTEFCVAVERLPAAVEAVEVRPLDCWWNAGRALVRKIGGDILRGDREEVKA